MSTHTSRDDFAQFEDKHNRDVSDDDVMSAEYICIATIR